MEFFDSTKSIVENLYLLSGPILAVFGFMIFQQIRLAKKSIVISEAQILQAQEHLKTSSRREAASMAAERTDFFIASILTLGDKLYDKKKELNWPEFPGKIGDFRSSEYYSWDEDYRDVFIDQATNDPSILGLELINLLEGFSAYFVKGVADEEIAFDSVGPYLCNYVEIYYPLIALMRPDDAPVKSYNNLISLYTLWKTRIKSFETEREVKLKEEQVAKDLKDLENLKNNKGDKPKGTKPIGT